MAFIAKFTATMKHIEDSANLTADALLRVEINSVVSFQSGLDYSKMAQDRMHDKNITALLYYSSSSLQLCQYALPDHPEIMLWCDNSMSTSSCSSHFSAYCV